MALTLDHELLEAALTIDQDLRAAGYALGRDEFYDLVQEVRASLYPAWCNTDLACHPREALTYCQVVRQRADAPIPDHVILLALFDATRQGAED